MSVAHRLIILIAFTASGCAGLIYESVWSHYLGLYLGHAAYAQTLTLAIFMGGMTIGAYAISRRIDTIKNALLGYAIAEFALGVLGLLFHYLYTGIVAFSYDTVFPGLGNTALIDIYKWTSGALLILPQSIILGSTFPLLCSALMRREQQGVGKHISILYFTNSIGAAAGALIATFILLPSIGMPGAMLTSGIINLVIAIVTYYVSKQGELAAKTEDSSEPDIDQNITKIILIAAAMTGAVSFMYEIAWIRMLNLVLGTSLHAFEIMLSAFIAGLAFGGWWIKGRIDKIPDILRFTGQVQVFMGLAAISTLTLYFQSFDWVATLLSETLQKTDTSYFFYNLVTSLISGLIMIPATFCAGMTLPLLTTLLIRRQHNENAIGRVYASNTIGAIIGIMLAVHVGMTLLGLKWLIIVAGGIDIGLGIFLIGYSGKSLKWVSIPSRFIAACLLVGATLGVLTELNPSRLASGTFRYARAEMTNEIIYYQDGKTATISVQKSGDKGVVSIATNGKPDAGLRINLDEDSDVPPGDEVTMAMLGSIALLINPDLEDAANIGFGSGMTSHILLSSPALNSLDTIEIEPAMVEGAKLFTSRNSLAYEDKRSNIHIEDAKTFFAAHQKKYDAIISEPSNPWVMGVGNLFTHEFYENIKRHLNDDGILVQWLHLYEISLPTLLTALNALNLSFEKYDLYATNRGDILFVATPKSSTDISIKTSWNQLPAGLRNELEIAGLTSIASVEARKLATKHEIEALIIANNASHNSDYFPLLSLNAPRDRFKKANSTDLFALQFMGIFDVPYRHPYQKYQNLIMDEHFPNRENIELTHKVENRLVEQSFVPDLDFATRGYIDTVSQPENYCQTESSIRVWIQAFYNLAVMANNFGSEAFRKKLLSLAERFECGENMEENATFFLDAIVISLDDFGNNASTELRNSVTVTRSTNLDPDYRSFIISCYLSSLIDNPAVVTNEDLALIGEMADTLDTTNIWLRQILIENLTP